MQLKLLKGQVHINGRFTLHSAKSMENGAAFNNSALPEFLFLRFDI